MQKKKSKNIYNIYQEVNMALSVALENRSQASTFINHYKQNCRCKCGSGLPIKCSENSSLFFFPMQENTPLNSKFNKISNYFQSMLYMSESVMISQILNKILKAP